MTALARLKAATRRAAYRTFATARAYNRAVSLWDDRRRRPPIVVYQMGKVGSQAVVHGLERTLGGPVFHVHFLQPDKIAWAEETYRRGWDGRRDPDHLWDSLHLRGRLPESSRGPRWKVVSLVRDPVARNVSSFFQIADLQYGIDLERLACATDREAATDELTDVFLHHFDEHDVPERWFDEELCAVLGVDVYEAPFPARGWSLHTSSCADALVLQLERLGETAHDAFRAHLGVPVQPFTQVNVGGAKGYGSLYEEFVSGVRLPQSYLDRVYASRYATHFYSPSERTAFAQRWAGPPQRSYRR